MKEWLLMAYEAIEAFSAAYGLYIACAGTGFLIAMAWWFKRHPEDFGMKEVSEDDGDTCESR